MSRETFDFLAYIERNAKRRKELGQNFYFRLYEIQSFRADFILDVVRDVQTKTAVWASGVDVPTPLERFALFIMKDLADSLYTPPPKEEKDGKSQG